MMTHHSVCLFHPLTKTNTGIPKFLHPTSCATSGRIYITSSQQLLSVLLPHILLHHSRSNHLTSQNADCVPDPQGFLQLLTPPGQTQRGHLITEFLPHPYTETSSLTSHHPLQETQLPLQHPARYPPQLHYCNGCCQCCDGVGPGRLCQHHFKHNRLSIFLFW